MRKYFKIDSWSVVICLLIGIWSCTDYSSVREPELSHDLPATSATNPLYITNQPPLLKKPFIRLPLGAIKPAGWLKDQLIAQKNGLTGHLDEFWLPNSIWRGGDSEMTDEQLPMSWSRGAKFMTQYIEGLVALAYTLDDPDLKAKAQTYIDWILESTQPDGWFGIDRDFPAPGVNAQSATEFNAIILMMLIEYYDVSQDLRIIPLMQNYFRYMQTNYSSYPQQFHWGVRVKEHIVSALWLYNHIKDEELLRFLDNMHDKSFNWSLHFTHFPWHDPEHMDIPNNFYWDGESSQVYNIARAFKYPALWYMRTGDPFYKEALYAGLENLDKWHGQAGGRFSGDEHVSGRSPTQGSELCSVGLFMYSLEKSIEILGDPALADRLEMLAYNAIPATITSDFWAHQYDQQANQVLVSVAERTWSSNRSASNIFGLVPNFPCCVVGMHMPWPRFVEHMWMATQDGGVAAIAYGPNQVVVKVGKGDLITITQETKYPFDGEIKFKISTSSPTSFPLYLRIPAWADHIELIFENESNLMEYKEGMMVKLEKVWNDGDQVTLKIPMKIRTESRFNGSTSVIRGPLYYSLRIGTQYKKISLNGQPYGLSIPYKGSVDWEIYPTTPWNFGLIVNSEDPESSFVIRKNEIMEYPFSDLGEQIYNTDLDQYETWGKEAPIVLVGKGRRIPEWTLKNNSSDIPPLSPVITNEEIETLELVPYGCTRLRVTEFPTVSEP